MGCKPESHRRRLSSNARDTLIQGVPSSPAPAWQRPSGSEAAPAAAGLAAPGTLLRFPKQRRVLLRLFGCQGPSRKRELLQPQLALDSASVSTQTRPVTRNPRSGRAVTARDLRPSCRFITKQQRGWFLGFSHTLHRLATPSLQLPGLKSFAANPPQAAHGFVPAVPSQVTRSHWVALCPCLCSHPAPSSSSSLGTLEEPPARAREEGSPRQIAPTHGSQPRSATVEGDRCPGTPGSRREMTPRHPNTGSRCLPARLPFPATVTFSLPWQKEINCIFTISPSIKLIGQAIGTAL